MLKRIINYIFIGTLLSCNLVPEDSSIDRESLVSRNNLKVSKFDSLASFSVGNGGFAFTADITGLQSFPEAYAKGIPLGTQSEWGWHSFPNKNNYDYEDAFKTYNFNGRDVKYPIQWVHSDPLNPEERSKQKYLYKVSNYFRQNPHRIHLANLGFDISLKDGSQASLEDIKDINQELNMWTGEIHSTYTIEGEQVKVSTFCHQNEDVIGVKVHSKLLETGQIKIRLRLPFVTENWKDVGNHWENPEDHASDITSLQNSNVVIVHEIDNTKYFINLQWNTDANIEKIDAHYYVLSPLNTDSFELSCGFNEMADSLNLPSYTEIKENSIENWSLFWNSGGAVDLSGSTDPRAQELERRIITSQYLTKIQCSGNNPPQETGLTFNSWYGRPHMEMIWWHGTHFPLWGRSELLEKSLGWYKTAYPEAKRIAERQGYDGIRWQKMTDNDGRDTPSSTGAFLIWQQPHIIYFAEMLYTIKKDEKILNEYSDLIFETADFMASYAYFDSTLNRYILGKGLIAAQERFNPVESFNPAYELAYWHWALHVAQTWRKRLELDPVDEWDNVINNLSPLAIKDNKYLVAESATDGFTNPVFRSDHPSVLGAFGMLPLSTCIDTVIMKNTFDWIWDNWLWEDTWGWDFPMTAMTATRLGKPNKAIDALFMPIITNTYLPNGHNYKDGRLTLYLPANGGLLTAVALMCAGWEGCTIENPGFPKDGSWNVQWEGLEKMF